MPTTSVEMVRTNVVAAASAIPIAKSKDRKGTVKLGQKKKSFSLFEGRNQETMYFRTKSRGASATTTDESSEHWRNPQMLAT
jgi:hypothetical protein